MDDLTLRPSPTSALWWSAGGLLLLAIGAWLVNDASGDPQMWVLLGIMVAVAMYFVLQLVLPSWFEVHLDDVGVRARTAWQHLDVSWDRVQGASLRTFAGEDYLRLDVIDEIEGGWVVNPVSILLPLGADTGALRVALARARTARTFDAA